MLLKRNTFVFLCLLKNKKVFVFTFLTVTVSTKMNVRLLQTRGSQTKFLQHNRLSIQIYRKQITPLYTLIGISRFIGQLFAYVQPLKFNRSSD